MGVKIIDSTQKTIQPYVCFNPFAHSLSFQKNIYIYNDENVPGITL